MKTGRFRAVLLDFTPVQIEDKIEATVKATVRPYREAMRIVWPLALGMANNALMQFTDRVFLGRYSDDALEAVLPASMLTLLFLGFFQAVVAYSATFVAQYEGAKDPRGCVRSYGAGMFLSLVSALALAALVPVGHLFLAWGGNKPAILPLERVYFDILMFGSFALNAGMAAMGYFIGRGYTRTVLAANILGNVLNILLDWWLIFGWGPFPRMGIAGAALGTVISQAAMLALLLVMSARDPAIGGGSGLMRACMRIDGPLTRKIVRYGLPTAAYATADFSTLTFFTFLTGRLDELSFAVSNVAFSVNYLLLAPIQGFAMGAGTLVGQYQGAGDSAGATRAGWRVLVLAELYTFVAGGLILGFHEQILDLFTGASTGFNPGEFVHLGFILFTMLVVWQFFDASDVVLSGALKGAGDTRFVMGWMLVMSLGCWMPLIALAWFFHRTMTALWMTMVVYVIIYACGTLCRWLWGPWKKIRLVTGKS